MNIPYELYQSDVSTDVVIGINAGFLQCEPGFVLNGDALVLHTPPMGQGPAAKTFRLEALPDYASIAIKEGRAVLVEFHSFGMKAAYGVTL